MKLGRHVVDMFESVRYQSLTAHLGADHSHRSVHHTRRYDCVARRLNPQWSACCQEGRFLKPSRLGIWQGCSAGTRTDSIMQSCASDGPDSESNTSVSISSESTTPSRMAGALVGGAVIRTIAARWAGTESWSFSIGCPPKRSAASNLGNCSVRAWLPWFMATMQWFSWVRRSKA